MGHHVFRDGWGVGAWCVQYRHASVPGCLPVDVVKPYACLGDGAQRCCQAGGGVDQFAIEGDVQARLEHAVASGLGQRSDEGGLVVAIDLGILNALAVVVPDAVLIGEVVKVQGDGQPEFKESVDFLT